jgi:hypothetical protein
MMGRGDEAVNFGGAGLAELAAGRLRPAGMLQCKKILVRSEMDHCVATICRATFSPLERTFARERAMSTQMRQTQTETVRTAEQLRQWLEANRVYGLSAGQPDIRSIEATSLTDGTPTSIEVPAELLRALDAEMVWMQDVDTLPDGTLLALRSQLGNGRTTAH